MTLLDTNTLIHYLKGREPVVTRLKAASPRDLAISSVVAYEVEYGSLKACFPAAARWFRRLSPDLPRSLSITKPRARRRAFASI